MITQPTEDACRVLLADELQVVANTRDALSVAQQPQPQNSTVSSVVSFSMRAAGDIADFDAEATAANLASSLELDDSSTVEVNATAGSVDVDVRITSANVSKGADIFIAVNDFDAVTLTAVLGINVLESSRPRLVLEEQAPPSSTHAAHPPPPSPAAGAPPSASPSVQGAATPPAQSPTPVDATAEPGIAPSTTNAITVGVDGDSASSAFWMAGVWMAVIGVCVLCCAAWCAHRCMRNWRTKSGQMKTPKRNQTVPFDEASPKHNPDVETEEKQQISNQPIDYESSPERPTDDRGESQDAISLSDSSSAGDKQPSVGTISEGGHSATVAASSTGSGETLRNFLNDARATSAAPGFDTSPAGVLKQAAPSQQAITAPPGGAQLSPLGGGKLPPLGKSSGKLPALEVPAPGLNAEEFRRMLLSEAASKAGGSSASVSKPLPLAEHEVLKHLPLPLPLPVSSGASRASGARGDAAPPAAAGGAPSIARPHATVAMQSSAAPGSAPGSSRSSVTDALPTIDPAAGATAKSENSGYGGVWRDLLGKR